MSTGGPAAVFAVRCPAAGCRKYMLVEAAARGTTVRCLICRGPVRVPGDGPPPPAATLPVARLLPPPPPAPRVG